MRTEQVEHCGAVARLSYRAAKMLVNFQCRNGKVHPSRFTLKILQFSADQGMVLAMSDLGRFLYQCGVGRTVKRSGLEYIRQAAKHGDIEAQFLLGKAYNNGELAGKDDNAATHWWTLAADQGHPKAQKELSAQKPIQRSSPPSSKAKQKPLAVTT